MTAQHPSGSTGTPSADRSAPSIRPTVAFALSDALRRQTFSEADLARLRQVATIVAPDHGWARPGVQVLITGWSTPPLTAEHLDAMPDLRWLLHSAGSVKALLPPPFWQRGIDVSSAAGANALPVAEYTLAMILLAGKGVLPAAARYRRERSAPHAPELDASVGNYRTRIGLVAFSSIGRRVAELLRPFDLEVVVHDPYADPQAVRAVGAESVGLDELCATSQVVSVHAPSLPQTRHLIDAPRIALMQPGSTLINTARGALVDTQAMTEAVLSGRLRVVLDVTEPLVLPTDSPLWDHENVVLTPHVAGSLGRELHRLGTAVVDEITRICRGAPLAHQVCAADLSTRA